MTSAFKIGIASCYRDRRDITTLLGYAFQLTSIAAQRHSWLLAGWCSSKSTPVSIPASATSTERALFVARHVTMICAARVDVAARWFRLDERGPRSVKPRMNRARARSARGVDGFLPSASTGRSGSRDGAPIES
jgi:hypothetical protein